MRLLTPAIFDKITKLPIKWFPATLDAIHAEYDGLYFSVFPGLEPGTMWFTVSGTALREKYFVQKTEELYEPLRIFYTTVERTKPPSDQEEWNKILAL